MPQKSQKLQFKKKENAENSKTSQHVPSALNIWQNIFLSGKAGKQNELKIAE